jgi:CheY-like chemotaxis protein
LARALPEFSLAASRSRVKTALVTSARRGSGTRCFSEARRVLIVDDNHDSAELLSLALERQGHETRIAYDPRRAIPLALEFRPNLAFLDIGLPGMDGHELLAVLRAAPELQGCKFVAVTGYDELTSVPGSRGFDGHLLKPIDLNAIANLVLEISKPELGEAKPVSA